MSRQFNPEKFTDEYVANVYGDGDPDFWVEKKKKNISMIQFKQYLSLNEALITFSKKSYPKYGHFVILAGGSGSGKGWVIKNLLGIEARIVDVDHLKTLVLASDKLRSGFDKKVGHKVTKADLKDPAIVSGLHVHIDQDMKLPKKQLMAMEKGVVATDISRLPNLIFDNTLDKKAKLEDLTRSAIDMGYSPENIHLVWVVNDFRVALAQNASRSRSVSPELVMQKHSGVADTMRKIYDALHDLPNGMNGDVWFVFNNKDQDVSVASNGSGGYVSKATYFKVKESGTRVKRELPPNLLSKIKQYTPTSW